MRTIQSGVRVSRDQGALANLQRSGFCAALQYRADPDASDRCRARRHRRSAADALGIGALLGQGQAIGNKMINARSETLAERPAFRDLLSSRRCLVPADGFYEWRKEGKTKQPMLIYVKDRELFGFAGLWDRWKKPDGTLLESFTIATCAPNELMRGIHDRMPVIIQRKDEPAWLDPTLKSDRVMPLLAPIPVR